MLMHPDYSGSRAAMRALKLSSSIWNFKNFLRGGVVITAEPRS